MWKSGYTQLQGTEYESSEVVLSHRGIRDWGSFPRNLNVEHIVTIGGPPSGGYRQLSLRAYLCRPHHVSNYIVWSGWVALQPADLARVVQGCCLTLNPASL